MGCGNGVFSIYFCLFCLKHNHKHTHTHTHICETITFSDVCTDALSNAYSNVINLRQFRSLTREVSFVQSDVFERINKLYYLIFANMPQTPFRLTQSRPDKNGGVDGLKYNREVLQNWQKYAYENGRLIMLHSLLSSPKQFSRIVE